MESISKNHYEGLLHITCHRQDIHISPTCCEMLLVKEKDHCLYGGDGNTARIYAAMSLKGLYVRKGWPKLCLSYLEKNHNPNLKLFFSCATIIYSQDILSLLLILQPHSTYFLRLSMPLLPVTWFSNFIRRLQCSNLPATPYLVCHNFGLVYRIFSIQSIDFCVGCRYSTLQQSDRQAELQSM